MLVTLLLVLGVHVIFVWLLVSSRQPSLKTKSASLQLVWITRPATLKTAPERGTRIESTTNAAPRHRPDRTPTSPSTAPPTIDENNAVRSAPDWTEELHLVAKDVLAQELARKRHESDFAHVYPTPSKKPAQIAWNYAATHRVETLPEGGILIHLGDHCVLVLMPLPIVACGIGSTSANGKLFENLHN